jgi:hypothetical protein
VVGLKQFSFEGLIPSMVYQEFPGRANYHRSYWNLGRRFELPGDEKIEGGRTGSLEEILSL